MEARKSFEDMAVYLRGIRPPDHLAFDRMVRTVLFWLDTHRIKEPAVFLEQEGKEYQAFTLYLESVLGAVPLITPEFLKSMVGFAASTR
jgi:hypothetical protein